MTSLLQLWLTPRDHIQRKARLCSGFLHFMDTSKARSAYLSQKSNAARRGIEFHLTLEQWMEFWGDDLARRGPGRYELGMQRPCDSGPYAVGNIRKGTPKDNGRTRAAMHPKVVATVVHDSKRWRVDDEPNLGYASAWDMY